MVVAVAACSGSDDAGQGSGLSTTTVEAPERVDVLIRGGTVYDGENLEPTVADVGVDGDRIVYVGPADEQIDADRVIDADGMIVTPGFIDAHSHVDSDVFSDDAEARLNTAFITQGVTTAVVGNDGFGGYDIASKADQLDENPAGTNVAMFVGFGPIREHVLGDEDVEPDADELAEMENLVADAMCQGAIGLSTGLHYPPQNQSDTDEVVALAEVAARYGGIYDSHIRDEQDPDGLRDAIAELITIGREADLPVHVAHIKALGADAAGMSGEIIEMIETARDEGVDVTADQYPWTASSTLLSAALVPAWASAGGADARNDRFDDPEQGDRLREEMADIMRGRNGPEAIVVVAGGSDIQGRSIAEIADDRGVEPLDAVIEILRDGDVLIANFNQTDEDVEAFMTRPWVATSSDSSPGHPRAVGSFAEKYHRYVVEEELLSVGEFVRSSTSATADAYRIADRGRIQVGDYADIVVFDPDRFAANATYEDASALSEGIVATMVNGQVIVADDEVDPDAVAGRALLHGPPAGDCAERD